MYPLHNIQPHPRIIIRNTVKNLLLDRTDIGKRWFCSRPKPIFINELPCGLIYFTDEEVEVMNTSPRVYKRTLNLSTEVLHRLDSERDNALDDFLDSRAFEIETALLSDRYLGLNGLVQDCILARTEVINLEIGGDKTIASVVLHWNIIYLIEVYNKETIDEFLKFFTDYKVAQDNVKIREE